MDGHGSIGQVKKSYRRPQPGTSEKGWVRIHGVSTAVQCWNNDIQISQLYHWTDYELLFPKRTDVLDLWLEYLNSVEYGLGPLICKNSSSTFLKKTRQSESWLLISTSSGHHSIIALATHRLGNVWSGWPYGTIPSLSQSDAASVTFLPVYRWYAWNG